MTNCACGCGALVRHTWSQGHNRKGVSPTNRKGIVYFLGRAWLYQPDHHRASRNGYVKRAVIVLEQKLSRPLLPHEDTHHRNGNRLDDRPENLTAMSHRDHARHHAQLRRRQGGRLV